MSLWVRMLEHDGSMLLVVERARGRREERRRETESQIDIFSREKAPRDYSKGVSTNYYHLLGNNNKCLLSGCWGKVWLLQLQLFTIKIYVKIQCCFSLSLAFFFSFSSFSCFSLPLRVYLKMRERERSKGSYI